jgi:hypothetical protein
LEILEIFEISHIRPGEIIIIISLPQPLLAFQLELADRPQLIHHIRQLTKGKKHPSWRRIARAAFL